MAGPLAQQHQVQAMMQICRPRAVHHKAGTCLLRGELCTALTCSTLALGGFSACPHCLIGRQGALGSDIAHLRIPRCTMIASRWHSPRVSHELVIATVLPVCQCPIVSWSAVSQQYCAECTMPLLPDTLSGRLRQIACRNRRLPSDQPESHSRRSPRRAEAAVSPPR